METLLRCLVSGERRAASGVFMTTSSHPELQTTETSSRMITQPTCTGTSGRPVVMESGMQLTLSLESSDLEISITHFLVKMAQVSINVYPWDNKVLHSTKFDKNTASNEIYKLVCHLMKISGGHNWSMYSIQSWLTAGSWYLSAVSTIIDIVCFVIS
jgi:hypothetical protein